MFTMFCFNQVFCVCSGSVIFPSSPKYRRNHHQADAATSDSSHWQCKWVSTASLEGVLCSMCKHLKAVYLWAPSLIPGGWCKSPMMLSASVGGVALKALCSESWTYSFCFGNARWCWQFVYIPERQNRMKERKSALARKTLTTGLFIGPLKLHLPEKCCKINWRLQKKTSIFCWGLKRFSDVK